MWMRLLPYLFAFLGLASFIGVVYWKGWSDKADTIILEDLKATVKDQEILNEVRNNRSNDSELFDSLYSGTF